MKTMKLTQVDNPQHDPRPKPGGQVVPRWRYIVEEVVNSTEPAVGDILDKDRVDGYCDDANWNVTIRRPKG